MIVAFATDDGVNLVDRHFGDAKWFYVYDIRDGKHTLIAKVENTSPEERSHGDPNKAKGITGIMKEHGVQVLVGFIMGPNIVRMKKKFVPVISRCKRIDEAIDGLAQKTDEIENEISKEGEKDVIFVCQ